MVNYYVISKNEARTEKPCTGYVPAPCTMALWKCRTASTAYPVIWPG